MAVSFADWVSIQNTLSLYCVALDTKDFDLLHEVFTPDVEALYPFPGGNMIGIQSITNAIYHR